MAAERYAHLRADAWPSRCARHDAALIERYVAERRRPARPAHRRDLLRRATRPGTRCCGAVWNWDRSSHPPVGRRPGAPHRRPVAIHPITAGSTTSSSSTRSTGTSTRTGPRAPAHRRRRGRIATRSSGPDGGRGSGRRRPARPRPVLARASDPPHHPAQGGDVGPRHAGGHRRRHRPPRRLAGADHRGATMSEPNVVTITTYEEARDAYRQKQLRQALYDDGRRRHGRRPGEPPRRRAPGPTAAREPPVPRATPTRRYERELLPADRRGDPRPVRGRGAGRTGEPQPPDDDEPGGAHRRRRPARAARRRRPSTCTRT